MLKNSLFLEPLPRKIFYCIFAFAAVLILIMLVYPLGYDQSTFVVGGDLIKRTGAIPYRDFQDVKPPIIFYIYSLALWLFGHHVWSIRLLDVFWTSATAFYFYRILLRETKSQKLASIAMLLMVIRTVGVGYGESAQTESFAVIAMLVVMDVTLRLCTANKNLLRSIVFAGVATAILFFLKFTLVLSTAAACLYLVFDDRIAFKRKATYIIGTLLTFLACVGGYLLYLNAVGGLSYFREALAWAARYAEIDPLLAQQTITKLYYVEFPAKFIHTFTITGLLLGVSGIWWFLRSGIEAQSTNDEGRSVRYLYIFLILQTISGLLGVFIEKKYFPYHFTRAYWSFTPFIAIALFAIIPILGSLIKDVRSKTRVQRIAIALVTLPVVLFLAFFSPVMQLISQPLYYTVAAIRGTTAESVEKREAEYPYNQMQQLGNRLRSIMKPNERMFYWGMNATLYFFADRVPVNNVVIPTPYTASWVSPKWKNDAIAKLQHSTPEYVVVEWGDRAYLVTRTLKDSYQFLLDWPELKNFVFTNYHESFRYGQFIVFKRNDLASQH